MSAARSVVTMTAAAMVTTCSSLLSNTISVLEPAVKSFPVHSSGSHVSGHQISSQVNPLSGYTVGQTVPIYTSPMATCRLGNAGSDFETKLDTVTPGCVANPTGNPTGAHTSLPQSHFVDGPAAVYSVRDQLPRNPQMPQHVYSPTGCSTTLSVSPFAVQDNTFQDIEEADGIVSKLWFPSKQGAFCDRVSLQCFMVMLWNFLHL